MRLEMFEERVDPKHTALVVIDLQNDYCHPEGFWAKRGFPMDLIQKMLPRLYRFIDETRAAGVTVFFVRTHHIRGWTIPESWPARSHEPGGVPVAPDTWGAEFLSGVQPREGDYIITKHRYSSFIGTDLELVLRAIGIKTVLITGVAANVCCESTAREAYMRDFYVAFVEDGTATHSEAEHHATLNNIRKWFGITAKCDDIVGAWQRLGALKTVPTAR
ncbi:MAG: cysteine hydrolase [Chloroflexi bacterium]|nr:cysteine hydrolase [Chloroflexota bacterium]